jgi:hypothetical protein
MPGLHLHHNQHFPVAGNDIDLIPPPPPVGLQDPESLAPQVIHSDLLSFFTKIVMIGHRCKITGELTD